MAFIPCRSLFFLGRSVYRSAIKNPADGEEFARQYAEQGHSLVLVARRLERLQTLAEALRRQHGIDVVTEQVDLSDVAAVIQLHQRLRERGIAIDILINNAGHGLQGPFLDVQLDAALAMVELDVASLTAVTHIFAQDMRKRGRGKILLVASLLAYQGVQNFAVYSAAKAYVLRLGEVLHSELKRNGVTVTALCPGMSNTGFATAAQQKVTFGLKLLMMQAGSRGARRHPRVAGRTHERHPGLGEQGFSVFYVGDAALAAPSHFLARHERMSSNASQGVGRRRDELRPTNRLSGLYATCRTARGHLSFAYDVLSYPDT